MVFIVANTVVGVNDFYFLIDENTAQTSEKNKKKFDSLMICASILSPITLTLSSIMKLLEIHLKFPLKSVNYTNISGCGDITQENNIVKSMFESILMICLVLAALGGAQLVRLLGGVICRGAAKIFPQNLV